MSWLLKLLGLGKKLWQAILTVVRWVFADWRNGPLLMLAIFAAAHIFLIDPAERGRTVGAEKGWAAEILAHERTVENVRLAAEAAKRLAVANMARVKAEQNAITEEIVDDYQARIADARRRAAALAQRVPPHDGGAGRGGARGAPLPAAGDAARGAAQAAGEDRLPPAGELTPGDALLATEQAIQLDALIGWVIAQSKIATSPEQPLLPAAEAGEPE